MCAARPGSHCCRCRRCCGHCCRRRCCLPQYDKDENGTIDFDEFLEMAKVLVGSRTNFRESLPWKYGSGMWCICCLQSTHICEPLLTHSIVQHASLVVTGA